MDTEAKVAVTLHTHTFLPLFTHLFILNAGQQLTFLMRLIAFFIQN